MQARKSNRYCVILVFDELYVLKFLNSVQRFDYFSFPDQKEYNSHSSEYKQPHLELHAQPEIFTQRKLDGWCSNQFERFRKTVGVVNAQRWLEWKR